MTTLWAWVAVDEDGHEDLCARRVEFDDGPVMMPLIGADEARLHELRPYAEELHRRSGQPLRLVRFDRIADVEQLDD